VIDCVYIACGAHDSRFTRICLASVRFFYPHIPIRLLIGGRVRPRLLEELKRVSNVEMAAVPAADYGWGFIKLEPLFQNHHERFLMLDSDTILIGPVLEVAEQCHSEFIVDEENQSAAATKRLYYDWERINKIDPRARPPEFVFNSGQWFGSSNLLRREDFALWIDWSMPRRLRYPQAFMPGEQGILNYVLNDKVRFCRGSVARRKILRWPGHDLTDIELSAIICGKLSPYREIVHWAGFKAPRLESLPRADLLLHFERLYYEQHGGGERLRIARARRFALEYRAHRFAIKVKQRLQRAMGS
jgi:hypothetical protein